MKATSAHTASPMTNWASCSVVTAFPASKAAFSVFPVPSQGQQGRGGEGDPGREADAGGAGGEVGVHDEVDGAVGDDAPPHHRRLHQIGRAHV